MKRPLKPEEVRIWSLVAGTVHPLPGKSTLPSPSGEGTPARGGQGGEVASGVLSPKKGHPPTPAPAISLPYPGSRRSPVPPQTGREKGIEPNRKHRIAKDREEIGGRIDLHGMTQDRARAALDAFLRRAWDEGYRAVLVITGKGVQGDGILRRQTPEWLAAPALAAIVAGVSVAHRRHGGEGALYVALKRKPRG